MNGLLSNIIQLKSSEFGIDPIWVKAIITQESAWNQYATRYEVNYRWLYDPDQFIKNLGITLSTEIATQKISWGLGQIMGALAREQGHLGHLAELVDPDLNIKHICIRLKSLKEGLPLADEVFAAYNGGMGAVRKVNGKFKNQEYVDSVKKHMDHFSEGGV